MTLEEYIKSNYKEEIALPYDKWLIAQADFNGNGKIDRYEYKTNKKGRQIWTGRYTGEYKQYQQLKKDPSIYSQWEAYKETIIASNNEKLRQLKALWETSNAYEQGQVQSVDRFTTDNGIVTVGEVEAERAYKTNFVKIGVFAGVAILGLILVISLIKNKK